MVMKSMMASENTDATMTSWVRLGLYFACMKNRTTSEALKTAMVRATMIFKPGKNALRSTSPAVTVRTVPIIRAPNMAKQILGETMCSDTRLPFFLTPSGAIDQLQPPEQENPTDIAEPPAQAAILDERAVR